MALKAVLASSWTLNIVELAVRLRAINRIVGERAVCIDGHHLRPKNVAIIWSRGAATNQDFLCTILYGDAVGTKVSGRYRQGGRSSGVAVKMGSTVPYSEKLSSEKTFAGWKEVSILNGRKIFYRWTWHAKIFVEKISQAALQPQNWESFLSWSFLAYGS